MAINTGVNVSKLVAYAVVAPLPGVNVSKAVAYVVPGPRTAALNLTKLNAYAVLMNLEGPGWPSFSFGGGVLASPYSQSFSVTGTPPITLSVVSGALPDGLTLTASGNAGTVSGTPTVAGTFNFTLRASNSFGIADHAFSITVSNPSGGGGGGSFVWFL